MKKKRKKSTHPLIRHWTAGHEGLERNELVDREAKEAASRCNSDKKLLPSYLRKPLLINPTVLKTMHNTRLKKKWLDDWKLTHISLNSYLKQI